MKMKVSRSSIKEGLFCLLYLPWYISAGMPDVFLKFHIKIFMQKC